MSNIQQNINQALSLGAFLFQQTDAFKDVAKNRAREHEIQQKIDKAAKMHEAAKSPRDTQEALDAMQEATREAYEHNPSEETLAAARKAERSARDYIPMMRRKGQARREAAGLQGDSTPSQQAADQAAGVSAEDALTAQRARTTASRSITGLISGFPTGGLNTGHVAEHVASSVPEGSSAQAMPFDKPKASGDFRSTIQSAAAEIQPKKGAQ